MEFVLLLIALGLAGVWAGLRLAMRARDEAARLRVLNGSLEARVQARTAELRLALNASDQQARALAEANQAKADFLAGMSRELRTPLNAVMRFSDLMRMNAEVEPLTRRQEQGIDHIRAAGQHLLTLVEAVMDLSRIEGGRLSLSIERIDPHLVARQACDSLQSEAEAAGVALHPPPSTAGFGVVADRGRLRQVLTVLIANAIRYNRPGGDVLVELRQTAEGVAISVHDTGLGIPAARMVELFQPFSRLGKETSGIEGTGVDLAVSRRLAEAMQGRLEVVSEEGEGSSFTLHMPLAEPDAAPAVASVIPALRGAPRGGQATMLYVEDNPSNIALMRHVIAALGSIQLHVAETGHEGLALARDLRPDVIVLDINLPGLSGFELKARLDADPLTAGLPVLALSAGARPQDLKKDREAGFRDYLTKPLDIARLARALNAALGETADGCEAA